ncbi:MAG: AAA family ATPase, partial [Bacteroidota bacterium]
METATTWTFAGCPAPGKPLDWAALNAFDWVKALKDVPQSPVYHAEGDVWIHTRMVMEALLDLPGYQALSEQRRHELFLATLMHDIAKPLCTVIDPDGTIRSPRHALRGRNMSRLTSYSGEAGNIPPFQSREHIAQLVRYHGLPLWFLEKERSEVVVRRASLVADMECLALLAEADVRGRICADQDELLDRVEMFREYCKELGCWGQAAQFENGLSRFSYFRNPENGIGYVPFDDLRGEVILLSGLPGTGKDHWVAEHGAGRPVISLDEIRKELGISHKDTQGKVIQTAKARAKAFLREGEPF